MLNSISLFWSVQLDHKIVVNIIKLNVIYFLSTNWKVRWYVCGQHGSSHKLGSSNQGCSCQWLLVAKGWWLLKLRPSIVNFSVSKIFDLAKVPVTFFESHSYLTGVATAELSCSDVCGCHRRLQTLAEICRNIGIFAVSGQWPLGENIWGLCYCENTNYLLNMVDHVDIVMLIQLTSSVVSIPIPIVFLNKPFWRHRSWLIHHPGLTSFW